MITINKVSKIYHPKKEPEVKALDNITLTLGNSGLVFILGKSGSGKSTLLNVLGCLDDFDSGDILFINKSLKSLTQSEYDNYRSANIGFIFQDNNLLEKISVKNNIGIALDLQGIKDKDALISSALEKVDLKGYSNRYPNQLSGGQKQRVAIARAVVKNPPILLADEPTGNLDSVTSNQIFGLLKELSKERLVVVVSHDREAAELYGDRVIELIDGNVCQDDLKRAEDKTIFNENNANKNLSKYSFLKILAMSINNMRVKWIRMLVTIILFVFALTLFGLGISASTIDINLQTLNSLNTIEEEIIHIAPDLLPTSKAQISNYNLNQTQTELIENSLPEFKFNYIYNNCYIKELPHSNNLSYYNNAEMAGCVVMDAADLKKYDMTVVSGRLPQNSFEVAIPYYIYEAFNKKGYRYYDNNYGEFATKRINNYQDIIGLEINISRNSNNAHNIVGIIDTKFDYKRFEFLKTYNAEEATREEYDKAYNLTRALDNYISYSVHASLFVTQEYIDKEYLNNMTYVRPERFVMSTLFGDQQVDYVTRTGEYSHLTHNEIQVKGIDIGSKGLANNEIIVSKNFLEVYLKKKDSPYNYTNTESSLNNIIANGLSIELMIGNNMTNYYDENFLSKYYVKGYYDNYSRVDEEGYYLPEIFFNDSYISHIFYNDGIYKSIITKLSDNRNSNLKLIEFTYNEDIDSTFYFPIKTIIREDLDLYKMETASYRKVGLLASFAFGLFTVLMMLNFIISNIIVKSKETGILRALGLSSRNVFMIFFIECLILSITAFSISIYPLIKISEIISIMSTYDILIIPLFTINILTIILMFVVSIIIAFLGSFAPIYKIAKKKPVEIIRKS